jgi:hypothetical protein
MKIYRLDKGFVLVGKAWEIRTKLREYSRTYTTVNEWIQDGKTLKHPVHDFIK